MKIEEKKSVFLDLVISEKARHNLNRIFGMRVNETQREKLKDMRRTSLLVLEEN